LSRAWTSEGLQTRFRAISADVWQQGLQARFRTISAVVWQPGKFVSLRPSLLLGHDSQGAVWYEVLSRTLGISSPEAVDRVPNAARSDALLARGAATVEVRIQELCTSLPCVVIDAM
jgi:hypothetical protein